MSREITTTATTSHSIYIFAWLPCIVYIQHLYLLSMRNSAIFLYIFEGFPQSNRKKARTFFFLYTAFDIHDATEPRKRYRVGVWDLPTQRRVPCDWHKALFNGSNTNVCAFFSVLALSIFFLFV